MAIAVILAFLFLAGIIAPAVFIGISFIRNKNNKKYNNKKKTNVILIAVMIVCFVLFLTIPFSIHQVKAGEVAVVKHMGEATSVRTAGTYFDFWITEKYEKYDAKVQTIEIASSAYSKDAQTMDLKMTVQYQIDTSKVIEISNHYGNIATLADRVRSISVEKTKSTLSAYSAMTIIETRANISPEIEGVIKESVASNYYVDIVAVVLTDIDFSDAFEKTVEDKMIAEQEKLKAEYEKATAIVNAEKELEVAKLDAQAKIEKAKADAQAQIEVARAEAQALKLKSVEVARALGFNITESNVTDDDGVVIATNYDIDFTGKSDEEIKLITEYLKYIEYLSKWDGKLPDVIGDGTGIMITVPQPNGN
ncbi:MAG: prohibitin family protein [Clostridia bacterium]|nr:prohibitin family protein [Clostridia bacterium]